MNTIASFSGVDTKVIAYFEGMAGYNIPNLVHINISSYRDSKPVRTLGTNHDKGRTKGWRTIAGTMIFSVLGEQPLRELINIYNLPLSREQQKAAIDRIEKELEEIKIETPNRQWEQKSREEEGKEEEVTITRLREALLDVQLLYDKEFLLYTDEVRLRMQNWGHRGRTYVNMRTGNLALLQKEINYYEQTILKKEGEIIRRIVSPETISRLKNELAYWNNTWNSERSSMHENIPSISLLDQLPPISLIGVPQNEVGDRAIFALLGVTFPASVLGMGVSDSITENSIQFVATDYYPLESRTEINSLLWKREKQISVPATNILNQPEFQDFLTQTRRTDI